MSSELLLHGVPCTFAFPSHCFLSLFSLCWCHWGMAVKVMWELGSSCIRWGILWPEHGNFASTSWMLRCIELIRWFQPPPILADLCLRTATISGTNCKISQESPVRGKRINCFLKFSFRKCTGRHHRRIFFLLPSIIRLKGNLITIFHYLQGEYQVYSTEVAH